MASKQVPKGKQRMTPKERRLWLEFNEHLQAAMVLVRELYELQEAKTELGLRRIAIRKVVRKVNRRRTNVGSSV